jgi:hypothetical protein
MIKISLPRKKYLIRIQIVTVIFIQLNIFEITC